MQIKNMPQAIRPREKLLSHGPQSLTSEELLAIVIASGTRKLSALQLAEQLINHFGGLFNLLQLPAQTLAAYPGLGPAKSAQIAAIKTLTMRSLSCRQVQNLSFDNLATTKQYCLLALGHLQTESLLCLFLDNQYRFITDAQLAKGNKQMTLFEPRSLMEKANEVQASYMILCHNHPGCDCKPSSQDIRVTRSLKRWFEPFDICILDHIVVGADDVYSMHENQLI